MTAALEDDDIPTGVTWQWSRSPNGRTDWVNVAGATLATYTPTLEEDRGNYIRATASYTDGDGPNKSANAVSPRVGDPPPVNSPPVFPSTENGQREVEENSAARAEVGGPVAATDLNAGDSAVNDPLTYSLTGTDAASFTIDEGTGQISLAPDAALDYEGKRTHRFTVQVTDGRDQNGDDDMDAIDDTITVTVTVTDVNEAPVVSGDASPSVAENLDRAVATYTGADPERDTLTWSVSSNDFWISSRGGLYFRTPPSHEAGQTYTVTVTATDDDETTPLSGSLVVSITVMDVEEEGVVAITPPRGWVDVPTQFMARLTDGDGGITGDAWQWERSPNGRSSWSAITGARLSNYTVTANDASQYLRATASYEDRRSSNKTASAALTVPVGESRLATNTSPEFTEDDDDTDTGRSTTRTVREGTAAGRAVGSAVRATDPDSGDVLTYSLSGTDAGAFDIDAATGQIRTKAVLEHNPDESADNTRQVTVSVHDGFDGSYNPSDTTDDTIEVTITVTDAPAGQVRPPRPLPPPPPQVTPCVSSLGTLEETAATSGSWASDCQSQASGRGYARYYSFTLADDGEVTIDLTSTVDTHLYLREGEATSGTALHENGNIDSGNTDSRIVAALAAGTYTIEATTASAGLSGDFTLSVSGGGGGETPVATGCTPAELALPASGVSGSWADGCQSEVSGRGYARYYTFTLSDESEVTINLTSSVDTYLYLREGSATSGTALHDNDDIESGNTNSQIVATLSAGTYTIEATTYSEATTGSFTLSVSGGGGTETPVATGCTPAELALPASGVSGSWADGCQSEVSGRGYARYYTFTLSDETEVTIDLTSSVDTYLYLREGSATSGTALHDNDDIESGNTNSQIVATLSAGTYTIEATTYSEATTGSFTLSVSGGGGGETPVATGCTPAELALPASGVSGSWADGCQSEVSGRGYARYYTFTLSDETEVTIDLTSSVDTYLYLREGSATSGTALHDNDDIESGNTNSQIVATLSAGTYTIEATTYSEATTGSFTLSVSGGGGTETPVATGCTPAELALPASGVSGSWADGCQSEVSGRGYARYYTFTLSDESEVTIDLTSSVDTYLYLREGSATSGTALHDNDDIESGNTNSQIVATLSAGTYTIEATTYSEATTGSFTLSVSGGGGTETPVATGCTPAELALPASGVSGSWADGCQSEVSGRGYARYYTFTLSDETEVTIDLTSTVDTYLYLREGSATSGTALHDNDDIESGNTNSQIVATLSAGTYTIEATTYSEATTGSFTLSVSGGGGGETPVATGCTPAELALPASGVSGSWADGCQSEVSGRGYARYYTFTLSDETEVTIDLTSSVDTYLYLREGSATSGTAAHSNDDIESGNTDSQIVADLDAGTYTIEATTYSEDTAGSFTLSVSST